MDIKVFKNEFRKKTSMDPDKYYATSVLRAEGFTRNECGNCGKFFWDIDKERKVCGDPACSGGFKFFKDNPAKNKMDYIGVWKRFSELFKEWGYTPIKRYPVTARWRDDTDFVQASIYDFQPYVVSGEVDPPANPLVVPQFCLRFNDIDNVGITGAHYSGFVMIGQHAFMTKEEWDQDKVFRDIYNWLVIGLGLPKEEITFHEDVWAGGGNFGPCMEYFSRGLELGNQVYMLYEQTPTGNKELRLKVLDMGMGHERNAWFTQGKATSYETTFPTVCEKLYAIANIVPDQEIIRKFLPYASYLNTDEVEDIQKVWIDISHKIDVPVEMLKAQVLPLAALYSVAEHSRSLLFALSDGALPSNVGGGYNLRVLLRRALGFIDEYKWDVTLQDITSWHAEYLRLIFPELYENLDDVHKILDVEVRRYHENKKRTAELVEKIILKEKDIGREKLIELYDSNGIAPELIKAEAKKLGLSIDIPDNFYALVAERHEKTEQMTATKKEEKLALDDVAATEVLYFDDWKPEDFKATVIKVIGNNVILDRTWFYPTSGGQIHDLGFLKVPETNYEDFKVLNVFKQGKVIIHVVEGHVLKVGDIVEGHIDIERRLQLAQHHSATHILNGAAKKVLGNHIFQAGAAKGINKARLDITHFEALDENKVREIEKTANDIIKKDLKIRKSFIPRTIAEQKYGFAIYQGGAVPGKELRIVGIENEDGSLFDIEACGGTHLNSTSETDSIKIVKTSKIQDGIVRLEFMSGNAAKKERDRERLIIAECMKLLDCKEDEIPGRVEELFNLWKSARKKSELIEIRLQSKTKYVGNALEKAAVVLKTQKEFLPKTIQRFMSEIRA